MSFLPSIPYLQYIFKAITLRVFVFKAVFINENSHRVSTVIYFSGVMLGVKWMGK